MTRPDFYPRSPVAPATGKKIYGSNKAQAGCLFLTVNTHKRIPLFRDPDLCRIFFDELAFYRKRYGFQLYGYVLMPNHFHLLLGFPPPRKFSDFLRDFKSALGRLVIDWEKQKGSKTDLLHRLRLPAQPKRRRDPAYRVLQPNSYVRVISSASLFKQKLDYVHTNPVRERLVTRATEYPYSSLQNYERGVGPALLIHTICCFRDSPVAGATGLCSNPLLRIEGFSLSLPKARRTPGPPST